MVSTDKPTSLLSGTGTEVSMANTELRNRLMVLETLQSLGCIPRSPSPEPDHALMLERTEDMLRVSKQQAREQNLRILALEVSQ
jgi:hypothetical protein